MTLKKLVCQFCQKTIRKDFVPIQCQTCLADFHKKCAKILKNQAIASNNFYDQSNYLFFVRMLSTNMMIFYECEIHLRGVR